MFGSRQGVWVAVGSRVAPSSPACCFHNRACPFPWTFTCHATSAVFDVTANPALSPHFHQHDDRCHACSSSQPQISSIGTFQTEAKSHNIITMDSPSKASPTAPSSPDLRRDSVRPRLKSTDANDPTPTTISAPLTKSLSLILLALTALRNTGETPTRARNPARAAALTRLVRFVRDAWTEEKFSAEVRNAEARLPVHGALDTAAGFAGLWLFSAIKGLRDAGLQVDARDLEEACRGLEGERAEAMGGREKKSRTPVGWDFLGGT